MTAVRTGLDRIAGADTDALASLKGKRIGLVAHPASVDSTLKHAVDVLRDAGLNLTTLFGPEHGYGGSAQDMIGVGAGKGPYGLPIHSLYGDREEDLYPKPEWFQDIDVVIIDLQDVGARYYTYVWTAALVLKEASKAGVLTVVLDRPNPIGGKTEGVPQRPGYRSFVGLFDVPIRHGMTIGEVARFVVAEEGIDPASLEVVEMLGYDGAMHFRDTGLPWVMPSPNMPTPETALVYPGGCLLEGTNLSEGRGTTRPFELFGAPYLDGNALSELELDGARLRPTTIEPTFQKHAKTRCGAVQLHVTDASRFRPVEAFLRLIYRVAELHPKEFEFRTETYEFVTDRPAIDLLTGGPEYRRVIEQGAGLEDYLANFCFLS